MSRRVINVTAQMKIFTAQFCHYVASEVFSCLMLPTYCPDGALMFSASNSKTCMAIDWLITIAAPLGPKLGNLKNYVITTWPVGSKENLFLFW